jgi:hypothetical protein
MQHILVWHMTNKFMMEEIKEYIHMRVRLAPIQVRSQSDHDDHVPLTTQQSVLHACIAAPPHVVPPLDGGGLLQLRI